MKVPSYLQDTRQMLMKVKCINEESGPLPQQTRLVAVDAVAMYPSVPSEGPRGGVAAAEQALLSSGMNLPQVKWLVKLLKMVLGMNTFVWDSTLLRQKFGTAIGTSCAHHTRASTWKRSPPKPSRHGRRDTQTQRTIFRAGSASLMMVGGCAVGL